MRIKNLIKNDKHDLKVRMKPLAAHVCHILAGSVLVSSMSWMEKSYAAPLPLPVPPGATWAKPGFSLPQVSLDPDHWQENGANSYKSGSTNANYSENNLDVEQSDQRVILNWDSFDIDPGHKVQFYQPNSNSIALNRINERVLPSQILGSLKANGQLYLINKNGFIFGSGSVVDVNSLVVSTLDVADDVFMRGITTHFDQTGEAAFNAIDGSSGEVYVKDPDTGDFIYDADGQRIKIKIDIKDGASISSADNGRIMMFAPSINNSGTITSPEGQVMLAAATDKVYLQQSDGENGINGLLVEVGTGGDVTNLGNILTERGNTTLMGFAVNQQGLISATTSVHVNGSIRLVAREGISDTPREDPVSKKPILEAERTTRSVEQDDGLGTRANVTLGAGSVTQVLPETDDNATAADGSEQPQSLVEMFGQTIHLRENSTVFAPSATVDITATETPTQLDSGAEKNSARILMEAGSLIDVSGIESVVKSMESNVLEVKLQSEQLADSSVQKNGILFGETVRFDIRKETDFANISGELAGIQRTVAERSTEGGEINLSSQGDVIIKQGAELDISGGSVVFEDGYIDTTSLVATTGEIVDINDADPDMVYDAILGKVSKDYDKWGITRTWQVSGPVGAPTFEQGYIEGKDAGTVNINTHQLILDGNIISQQHNGPYQRSANSRSNGGRLNINLALHTNSFQNIVFQNNKQIHSLDLEDEFPEDGQNPSESASLTISPNYFSRNGLQHVSLTTNGNITVAESEKIKLPDGGSLGLHGDNVYVSGDIEAHAAKLNISTLLDGDIIFSDNTLIDVSGHWVNDNPSLYSDSLFSAAFIDAGSVTVDAKGDVILPAGSNIDARGGAWYQSDGKFEYGQGGNVTLKSEIQGETSRLVLEGKVEAHSFSDSGTLSLTTNGIEISSGQSSAGNILAIDAATIFNSGFSKYEFNSNRDGVTVTGGTHLRPDKSNRVLDSGYDLKESFTELDTISHTEYLPEELRQAVDIKLSHLGSAGKVDSASITLEADTSIIANPGSQVELVSDSSIYVNGQIVTPGGEIILQTKVPGIDRGFIANQGIWLGAGSLLSSNGTFIPETNKLGLRDGTLLDGGQVSLLAERGYIVMDANASIDVSGTETTVDISDPDFQGLGSRIIETIIASNAGDVSMISAEGIIAEGSIKGIANKSSGAEGGSLHIELDQFKRSEPQGGGTNPFPDNERVIHVVEENTTLSRLFAQGDELPENLNGQAYIGESLLSDSGFDSVSLVSTGTLQFHEDAGIIAERQVILDAPRIANFSEDGSTGIVSSYVKIGTKQNLSFASSASSGSADFLVSANLIDLTSVSSLQGFDNTVLKSNTDIRLNGITQSPSSIAYLGEWHNSGELTLSAQQVYPTTLSEFTIYADNVLIDNQNYYASTLLEKFDGRLSSIINTDPSVSSLTPVLSAAGKIRINADNITQSGSVRAPVGEIYFNAESNLILANGSITSTSTDGQVIPFGQTQGGLDWLYPIGTNFKLIDNPPSQNIYLSASNIEHSAGATIDISGGGDLQSYEFVKGPGGSRDVFAGDEGFAILPGINTYSPYDPSEFPESGLSVGESIYLSGFGDLPAGEYALLPAHYALLNGAYYVRPQSGFDGITPGDIAHRTDGTAVVAGKRSVAGTKIRDAFWQGFAVEKGALAKQRSEFSISQANVFFTQKALDNEISIPFIPVDAGQITIDPGQSLTLAGELLANPGTNGRGGRLDINTDNRDLLVVEQRSDNPATVDGVELLAEQLNNLVIDSILLGGTRTLTEHGTEINVGASNVIVQKNNVTSEDELELYAPEIILAATDKVEIQQGTTVSGRGTSYSSIDNIQLDGQGAVLRVSSADQVTMTRTGDADNQSRIVIAEGAVVSAEQSMLMASGAGAEIDGDISLENGSLNLASETINLGDVPDGVSGVILDETILSELGLDELILTAHGSTNVYSSFTAQVNRLVLDSKTINSELDTGQVASINADTIRFTNSQANNDEHAASSMAGQGSFQVSGREVELDEGKYNFSGFSSVAMSASEQILGEGEATVTIDSDLQLQAPRITARSGADTSIKAFDHQIDILNTDNDFTGSRAGVGARLSMDAGTIEHGSRIELSAGLVELTATNGDINLDNNSVIDVSGVDIDFKQGLAYLPAGKLKLYAEQGALNIADEAEINLSAASIGDAGELHIRTLNTDFSLNGNIQAQALSGQGGRFIVEANSLSDGLDGLADKLAAAGFNQKIHIHSRTDDLQLGQDTVVTAEDIKITSDTGSLQIDGTINASGDDGGRVSLSAADNLLVNGVIDASANGAEGDGGYVELASIDSDNDSTSGINNQGSINVSGGEDGKAGEVYFRALRTDSNADGNTDSINVQLFGAIEGAGKVTAEAVRIYENESVIDTASMAGIHSDNDLFINRVDLNSFSANGITFLPGVELRSSGDMAFNDAIDLASWRYSPDSDIPGVLTLRAEGDLNINAHLSDGIVIEYLYGGLYQYHKLQQGESWAYRLIAGADVSSADVMAVQNIQDLTNGDEDVSGNLNLASDTRVRTGTGNIKIATANDLKLMNEKSVIYTAGKADEVSRWGTLGTNYVLSNFIAEYPVEGGDLHISTGGNINSVSSEQFMREWLVSTGKPDSSNSLEKLTAWGIAFYKTSIIPFVSDVDRSTEQSLASFGGGDMYINVAGDMNDVSLMLPNTGKQTGGGQDGNGNLINQVSVSQGGDLDLNVAGDIYGGMFYLANGSADINVDGALKSSVSTDGFGLSPILALGDAQFDITARNDISTSGVIDPMIVKLLDTDFDSVSHFFSYGENSAVNMMSLAGDIVFENNSSGIAVKYNLDTKSVLEISSSSLAAISASGDIHFENSMVLHPSAMGGLKLWANNNITTQNTTEAVSINMSDTDIALLPSIQDPVVYTDSVFNYFDYTEENIALSHANIPVHVNDKTPASIVARQGSIRSDNSLTFTLSKKSDIYAGTDIQDVSFKIQNINDNDYSSIYAGRDIIFNTPRYDSGNIANQTKLIRVSGPGNLSVQTGRHLDLGSSIGLESVGNTINTALADKGANVFVLSGVNGVPDYAGFAEQYIHTQDEYAYSLVNYVNNGTFDFESETTVSAFVLQTARTGFAELSIDEQHKFIRKLFYQELLISGSKAAEQGAQYYQDGYDAIQTLFPEQTYAGDIKLFFSKIQTLDGGDIQMMAPGGLINAGLASTEGVSKETEDLGIVAYKEGDVSAFVHNDFEVNESRVFALGGDDILVWSTEGDIDAGRGAKSAISAPQARYSFDASGNLVVELPTAVQGSGIRTAAVGDTPAGNVSLFAPKGIIDAGEAGIGGNNITLGATQVFGTDNIDIGGVSVGVPTTTASLAAGLTGVSDLSTSASKLADESASSIGDGGDSFEEISTGFLNIELVGFGDELRIQKK